MQVPRSVGVGHPQLGAGIAGKLREDDLLPLRRPGQACVPSGLRRHREPAAPVDAAEDHLPTTLGALITTHGREIASGGSEAHHGGRRRQQDLLAVWIADAHPPELGHRLLPPGRQPIQHIEAVGEPLQVAHRAAHRRAGHHSPESAVMVDQP